jgi:hypothetical protein
MKRACQNFCVHKFSDTLSPAENMFVIIAVYVPLLSVSVAMRRASASASWNGLHPRR